jgi:hypothetical protein
VLPTPNGPLISNLPQRMITAYREPDRVKGRQLMTSLIDALSHGVPPPSPS